jgi:hypothetical protein
LGEDAELIPINETEGIEVRTRIKIRKQQTEAGIALLISIFVLLLISVVAIALIVSSGTESALAGNYRSSTGVYYAALSGLEEARGRLLSKNPSAFKITDPSGFLPASGTPLNIGDAYYVINPVGGETVAPWDVGTSTTYPDLEFGLEFAGSGFSQPANYPSPSASSVWNRSPLNSLGLPGPLYKWVRINAVSEKSLNLDVDSDSLADSTTPLYYDGALSRFSNSSLAGPQVLEITSFAALPNGSQKLLQYLVTASPITLPPFLAALTLAGSSGNGVAFSPPGNSNPLYYVKGNDQDCNGNPVGSAYSSIGVFTGADIGAVKTGIQPMSMWNHYTGVNPWPDVDNLSSTLPAFPAALQTPSQLNAIAQAIIQSADAVVPAGTWSSQEAFMNSLGMSPSNMMTVVRDGDLDLTHWGNTGYGLLLVTGTYTFDPDNGWRGIVLVIGEGKIINTNNTGTREIDGAVFVAKTNSAPGVPLPDPNLGGASVLFDDHMNGDGIRYSSCWIKKAQDIGSYKVLSFHEISQ